MRGTALLGALILVLGVSGVGGINTADGARAATVTASWPMAGHDLADSHDNPDEQTIGVGNVGTLVPKWVRPFPSYLAATPAIVGGEAYLADRAGNMTAVNTATGAVTWTHSVAAYTGIANDLGRATPAVASGRVIFGDQPGSATHDGAHVLAVSATTGALLWNTVVDTQPTAKITAAPAIDGSTVYVGVSSSDEGSSTCCHFRGSVLALNATNGAILWRTYTAPAGYTGNAIWGSSPVIDHTTGLLYVGTGNNYSVPAGVCSAPGEKGCTPPAGNDYVDSLLALRLTTGAPAWSLRTLDSDVSTNVCRNTTACGPDFDFGSAPNLFTTTVAGQSRTLVGIGQKSGVYWAADAATGALVWTARVGPGGSTGGIQWGSATDGARIYVSVTNSGHNTYVLQPSGITTTGGAFSALDPATGKILWQTADPQGAGDFGFVSTANGVVYAGSGAGTGTTMYALDAATGQIDWQFASGGSVMGGAAIVNGIVYWASGYYTKTCPSTQPNCGNSYALYAFGLPPANTPPAVPASMTAQQVTTSSATLTWTPPATPGSSAVTGYTVTRNGVDSKGHGAYSTTVSAATRSFTMTSLIAGDTYTFTVSAMNASGTGPAASATLAITLLPGTPATLSVQQVGASSATLTWTPPANPGGSAITGYTVTRNGVDSAGHGAYSTTVSAATRTFTMTKLVNADTYTFTVSAINSSGTGSAASIALTVTQVPGVPATYTLVQSGPSSATLTWTPPANAGSSAITGYTVTRDGVDMSGHGAYSKTLAASARSFTMTNLVAYFTYTMTVRAINSSGAGPAASSQVTLTT